LPHFHNSLQLEDIVNMSRILGKEFLQTEYIYILTMMENKTISRILS
jgi:hypothetical protein